MVLLADPSLVMCRLLAFFSVLSIASYCSLILCSKSKKPVAPADRNPSVTYPSALVEPKPSSGTAEDKMPDGSKNELPADKKSNE
uniref:Uncharacterized protein n=1 Tax=Ditylenchus dipsaci TaxID=166011 RepID=A0A915ELL2_9BILA